MDPLSLDLDKEDVDKVLRYFGGDFEFMDQTYELLISDFDTKVSELELAADTQNFAQLASKAHAMKSSLVYFGNSKALDAIKMIEASARKEESCNYQAILITVKQGPSDLKLKIAQIKIHEEKMKTNSSVG